MTRSSRRCVLRILLITEIDANCEVGCAKSGVVRMIALNEGAAEQGNVVWKMILP